MSQTKLELVKQAQIADQSRGRKVSSATERRVLTASEMAAEFNVSLRTLKFYEDRGLLKSRRVGRSRQFTADAQLRMEMIIKGKQLGFTLSEIHDLIGNYERDVEIEQKISSTDLLQRQRKEIDEFVARLAKSPDDITHVPEFGDLTEAREVLARVYSWAGGETDALFWYRAQPIPAFGDRTAESLVKSGQAAALRDYLDSIAVGGFA